jgi:hypothetical protein
MSDIRRREFITLLGGAVAAWRVAVRAQRPVWPLLVFLGSGSPGPFAAAERNSSV